jgi:hypothetical protein
MVVRRVGKSGRFAVFSKKGKRLSKPGTKEKAVKDLRRIEGHKKGTGKK